ncbi:MAG: hypothetical protein GY772_28900 [bacterium]|nr:hypothetical protein [bacterium]
MTRRPAPLAWYVLGASCLAYLFRAQLREAWVQVTLNGGLRWPYYWGGGAPRTPWADGPKGVDCSGWAQMGLVRLGYLPSTEIDRGSSSLYELATPIPFGQQEPGDLAFWTGHVEIVYSLPDSDGDSMTIGARGSGSGSSTFGDNPNAYVMLRDKARSRSDFLGFGRLRIS